MTQCKIPGTIIRPYMDSDKNFILSSFVRLLKSQNPWSKLDPNHASYMLEAMGKSLIETTDVLVLGDAEDIEQIYAFIIGSSSDRLLHFLYTKNAFRGAKAATDLIGDLYLKSDDPITLTISTYASPHHMERWGLVYNSYKLLEVLKQND